MPEPRSPSPTLRILGTRGVPAAHGGFETFAQQLALHLVQRGWRVIVYCQEHGAGPLMQDTWQGIERVRIPVAWAGAQGTVRFDWKCILHATRQRDLCLTLGYNTALLGAWLRLRGVPNVINMDGIEWSRAKWGFAARAWLWLNDQAGCRLGNHLVADHPAIADHLATRVGRSKISTIAYGAALVAQAPTAPVEALGLEPGRYLTLIARPEPENSVLEVVQGFSQRPRGLRLAVLGRYDDAQPYHRRVRAAAGGEVSFLGALYDPPTVQALRFHALAHVHGHRVGGTNPSLVEALGAGNAVLAHDNRFNRWVAGDGARYFGDAADLDRVLCGLLPDAAALDALRRASRARFHAAFGWDRILQRYESLLLSLLPGCRMSPSAFRRALRAGRKASR
jgi:glycosyltransferase involved in cell wall biosynthesis